MSQDSWQRSLTVYIVTAAIIGLIFLSHRRATREEDRRCENLEKMLAQTKEANESLSKLQEALGQMIEEDEKILDLAQELEDLMISLQAQAEECQCREPDEVPDRDPW